MNKLMALTRIQLIDFFSKYTQQMNIKNKMLGRLMIFLPVLLLLPVIQLVRVFYDSFLAIGYPELIITYMFVGASVMAFFMAIPLVISVFFYAKDLSLIATLPVKKDTVIFAKLATVYVYLLGLSLMIFGPSVYFYAFGQGAEILRLMMGLIALILLPVLPMIASALLILPFMAVIGGSNKRNLMVIAGNLLLLVVIIGFQVVLSRAQLDPENLMRIVSQEDGLISLVGQRFPPSVWLTKMVRGSLLDTAWFVLMNLGFIVLLKIFANRFYDKAMIKYTQQTSQVVKKGKVSYAQRSKKALLIKRHIGIIIHNPTFLLNTVMTMFVPILLFVVYTAIGIMDFETLRNPMLEPFALYIFMGIILSPSIVGSLSATAITREGSTFWETRVLPVSVKENISARIQTTVLINLVATIALALLTFWILPLSILDIIIAIVGSFVVIALLSTVDLFINIERPFLNWSNPTAAVKNNMNIMFSLVIRVVLGIVGYAGYTLMSSLSAQVIVLIFIGLLFILYLVAHRLMYGKYQEKFIEMDI